jgi:amidohydrolase
MLGGRLFNCEQLKAKARDHVESLKRDLFKISHELYLNPEIAFQEVGSSKLLLDYLGKHGFSIEQGIGGISTAFRASFGEKEGGPTIALVAEYDALPIIGHGCGHNLIAAGAVGAGIGVAGVLTDSGLDGRIEVIGTPAEEYTEGEPGKVRLLESGVFDHINACLMFHPWGETSAIMNDLGCIVMDAAFEGRTAHAAADPWNGRNALDGVVATYNGLSMLRQQIRSDARIHMIITDGGSAVNVIPEKGRTRIMFRSSDMSYLEELAQKVIRCIEGASMATETQVSYRRLNKIYNTRLNEVLCSIVSNNFELFGIKLKRPDRLFASSDFGNLSQRVPAFSFFMKTHKPDIPWHSTEVRDASLKEEALEGMITAAKVLAMSAIDIISNPCQELV